MFSDHPGHLPAFLCLLSFRLVVSSPGGATGVAVAEVFGLINNSARVQGAQGWYHSMQFV